MKKVLIVTPNWPPVSYPDMHRVRMALPYFEEFGWEPVILTINPDEQQGIKDPMLCLTVPSWVRTRQAGCLPLALTKWFGIRSVGLRSHFHLAASGSAIIRELDPELVFFSTTMFTVTTLGRYWKKRHGVPYVVDFQDPWLAEDSRRRATTDRDWKYWASQSLAKRLEPFTLRQTTHVVSVSPAYPAMLRARYPWLRQDQFTVLPFGAAERDFDLLRQTPVKQTVFAAGDGKRHWVYVGRGGADMAFALRALFTAVRRQVDVRPELRSQLRIHFIGTDYAPDRAKQTVAPLAAEAGIQEMVTERTARLPYFQALQCLLDASALVVPGSDDPGYTASKLFPYILARRPLLAIFNEQSSVVDTLRRTAAGMVVPFNPADTSETLAERLIATGWLAQPAAPSATNWSAFERYSAREMTATLCRVFDRCVSN